ncbi:MAG: nucleoside deaminase [Chitinispirillaceae bacterium]|jgi:tRNA(adenine34) deaminase|nr:nucleoside deaminase [Chitinispirillaceae bacterium]
MQTREPLHFMQAAYQEALKSFDQGEVPIGAVIEKNGAIIGRGFNRIENLSDATAHAEIIAITAAASAVESWRLNECTLYVTIEPCIMCLGAVLQSRISAIVYGAADPRLGAIDTSSYRTGLEKAYGYFPSVSAGLMADECSSLVSSFFRDLRKKKVKS